MPSGRTNRALVATRPNLAGLPEAGWQLLAAAGPCPPRHGRCLGTENYSAFWTAGLPASGQGTQANPSPVFPVTDVFGSFQNPDAGTTIFQTDTHGLVVASIDDLDNLTVLERDASGRVIRETLPDPDGTGPLSSFVTEFFYDTAGNLTEKLYPDSTTEVWTYNSLNYPLTHIDRLGRTSVYTYDSAGNRTSERRVFGEIDDEFNLETDDLVTTMTYTPGGSGQPPKGLVATVTDPLGRVTAYAYNTRGLVTSITYADGTSIEASVQYVYHSTTDLLTQSIDELGRTTDYTYDNLGRLTLTTLPDPDAAGPLSRPTIAQTWNGNGRMTSQTDTLGRVTSYTYAHHGRVMSMTRPDHDNNSQLTVTEYDFDAAHRPTTTTDPLGRVTTTNYNTLGWVTSTVLPDPGGPGGPLTSPTTTYTYDNMGRVLTETNPLGKVTTYAYANFGLEVTITLPDPDGSGGPLASPVLFRQYDEAGNLILERDPLGADTTYLYDAADRLITVTAPDPDGSGPADSPVTTHSYDKAGNLVSTTDPLGNATSYTYDARHRRTHEILADPDGSGGPLTSPTTVYAYNAANELTSLTDPVNNATTWQYDGLGRVKLETNQLNKTRTFEYDAASNLIKRTDRLGRILQFEYDALNHLTNEKWYDGTTLVRTLSFSYDAADQLMSASDPAAVFSYGYDGLGRLTNEGQTITGLTPQLNFASEYSGNSQRTQLQAQIGGVADFKNTYQFDNLSRLTSLQQQGTAGGNAVATKRVDFTYDAASQYTNVTRYADIAGLQHVASSHYTHDLLGRMTKLVHSTSTTPPGSGWGSSALAGYQYAYDVGSRFTSIDSYLDGLTSYTHDNTSQLTGADHTGQTDESYSYDRNGNRTMTGYSTGTNNQLLSDGTYNYTYDDEGNRLTKTKISTGEKEEYTWDHRNRLTGVTFKNSGGTVLKTVLQGYDVFNRWIKRSVDPDGPGSATAVDTYFAHEDGQIVLDFDGPATSDLTHRYLWCEHIDQILASEDVTSLTSAGNTLWPLTDHLGTTRDIADRNESSGVTTVTNHRRFDSYGNLLSETAANVDILFAFTGRPFDESTILQNNRNRWYDSSTGRWISEDPIGFAGDQSNLNRYVANRPLRYIDPNGTTFFEQQCRRACLAVYGPNGQLASPALFAACWALCLAAQKGSCPGLTPCDWLQRYYWRLVGAKTEPHPASADSPEIMIQTIWPNVCPGKVL